MTASSRLARLGAVITCFASLLGASACRAGCEDAWSADPNPGRFVYVGDGLEATLTIEGSEALLEVVEGSRIERVVLSWGEPLWLD